MAEEIITLTIEEHLTKATAIKARLEELCGMSARAYTSPSFTPTWSEIEDECDKLVAKGNWHMETAAMLKCAESEKPLLQFCLDFDYLAFSVKDRKDKESEAHYLELSVSKKQMNLLKFNTFCGGNLGAGDWISAIQQLGLRLTLKAAASIGIPADKMQEIDDSYRMTKLAREVKLSKADESGSTPDPVSKNQMVKTLDLILTLMLGEEGGYHCDTRDVGFLLGCFTRKGKKALSLKTANNKELTGLIHQIAHRVATGKPYSIEAYVKPRA